MKTLLLSLLTATVALFATHSAHAQIITNGGFETGDFTGWTQGGSVAPTINSTTPLAGSFSATVNVDSVLSQSGFDVGDAVTTSFLMRMDAPTVAGDRGLNVRLIAPSSSNAINLRVVDTDLNGTGLLLFSRRRRS